MKCCFCKKEMEKHGDWSKGNNAQPIMNGRCCDKCNVELVIPIRMLRAVKSPILTIFKDIKEEEVKQQLQKLIETSSKNAKNKRY